MATFGWSVGDIVASVKLIVKISDALKEAHGAKLDYQESIDFLFGLETTLQNLRCLAPILVTPLHESLLQFEVEKIAKPIATFFSEVQKFELSLSLQSKRSSWRTASRKIQWTLYTSKEVKKLRDRSSVPMSSLNILLQSETL